MIVYVRDMEDWSNFVNGQPTIMYKYNVLGHVKKIIVSPIEIISERVNTVTVAKKY